MQRRVDGACLNAGNDGIFFFRQGLVIVGVHQPKHTRADAGAKRLDVIVGGWLETMKKERTVVLLDKHTICNPGMTMGRSLEQGAESLRQGHAAGVYLRQACCFGLASLPGKDGLVHISQISEERVENVSDKLSEGDVIKVKVLEIDKQGRIRLSMKAVEAA